VRCYLAENVHANAILGHLIQNDELHPKVDQVKLVELKRNQEFGLPYRVLEA
jgi:hypothetical protein